MENRSKPTILITIALALLLVSLSQPAEGEGKLNLSILVEVNITNDLDWEISSFYISSIDSDYYAGEMLSSINKDVLSSGESMTLYMVPGNYDILLFDVDYDIWTGSYYISDSSSGGTRGGSMDLSFNEIDLFFEEFGYIDETYEVEIEVYTALSVDYIFFSPSDSNSWGVDYLGESSLDSGDIYSFSFMKTESPIIFDLLVIFNDGSQVLLEVDGSGDAAFSIGDPPENDPTEDKTPVEDDDTPVEDEPPKDQQPDEVPGDQDDDGDKDPTSKSTYGFGFITIILGVLMSGILYRKYRKK